MKVIFSGEFTSKQGYTQRILILDRDAVLEKYTAFTIEDPGVRRSFRKKAIKPLFVQWIAQTIEFTWDLKTQFELDFLEDVLNADERRFHVRYEFEDPGNPGWFEKFRGYLVQDQFREPDKSSFPFPVKFRATDYIALAQEFDYAAPNGDLLTGVVSFKDHLVSLLNAMGVQDMYDTDDDFLGITVKFFETRMATINTDPMALAFMDHRAFADKTEEIFEELFFHGATDPYTISHGIQPTEPGNCGRVLTEIAFAWGGMLFQRDGWYHFVQHGLLAGTGQQHYVYKKDGSFKAISNIMGNVSITSTGTFDSSSQTAKFTGGSKSSVPPLRLLRIDHLIGSQNNLISGHSWDIYSNPNIELRHLTSEGSEKMLGSFVFRYQTMKDTAGLFENVYHRYKWGVKIKVGSYYIKRPAYLANSTVEFGDITWESSPAYVEMYGEIIQSGISFGSLIPNPTVTAEFETETGIPESGTLEVDIDLLDIVGPGGVWNPGTEAWDDVPISYSGESLLSGKYRLWWDCRESFLKVVGDENLNVDARSFIRYEKKADVNNSRTAKFDMKIGDDPGSQSYHRILIQSGGEFLDSVSWTYGTTGTAEPFVQLLASYMMQLRETRRRILQGEIFSKLARLEPDIRINYDGRGYMVDQVTIDERHMWFRGSWVEILEGDRSGYTTKSTKYNLAKSIGDPGAAGHVSPAGPSQSGSSSPEYSEVITGITSKTISINSGPLPDPTLGIAEVRRRFRIAMRGTANLLFKATTAHFSHFTIDTASGKNNIILHQDPKVTDEFTFVWI